MKKPGKRFSGVALACLGLGFGIIWGMEGALLAFVFAFLYILFFVTGIYAARGMGAVRKDLRDRKKARV